MLPDATRFYIGGEWVTPHSSVRQPVVNPADLSIVGEVALGDTKDVDRAVAAAKAAFPAWSTTSVAERLALLERITKGLIAANAAMADAITAEMGAPQGLSRSAQAPSGQQHFAEMLKVLAAYRFETTLGSTRIRREPIGVCALITPWNWPINQIAVKVAPALAAGCTMVLKPSELAPLSAALFTEILAAAGVPAGVFNLVQGDGAGVGDALTRHPDVDMVSFTGSTRAGIAISRNAAPTVKRVALELGGKSAVIVLPDADFAIAIPAVLRGCMSNSGQSCNAGTRLLVPADRLDEVKALAREAAEALKTGKPLSGADLGPLANQAQYGRVTAMIDAAAADGATLLAGGSACPPDLAPGLFVKPTLFADVTPEMTIAREEVFGPVLVILAYDTVQLAIEIANDSPYGLSGYVWGADLAAAEAVAARLRTGMVHLNGASLDTAAPFGGTRMSGNGREWGVFGLEEFLELKSIYGAAR